MPALLLYTRPNHQHPAIIEDLLDLAAAGQQRAVDAAITMLTDLHRAATVTDSVYAKRLQGLPVWELKTHARGGAVGGTRVYFIAAADGRAVIVNAEIKAGDTAGAALREAVRVARRKE